MPSDGDTFGLHKYQQSCRAAVFNDAIAEKRITDQRAPALLRERARQADPARVALLRRSLVGRWSQSPKPTDPEAACGVWTSSTDAYVPVGDGDSSTARPALRSASYLPLNEIAG
ncbi:hypothetical protein ACWEQG_20965 [Microbispora sp. NPDC004025]